MVWYIIGKWYGGIWYVTSLVYMVWYIIGIWYGISLVYDIVVYGMVHRWYTVWYIVDI